MDLLRSYGWDAHFETAFLALDATGCDPARVIEAQRGMFRVMTAAGELRAEASALRPRASNPSSAV